MALGDVRNNVPFPTLNSPLPTSNVPQGASNVPTELGKNKALEVVKRRYQESRQISTIDYERFARYYRLFRNRQTLKNYQGLANLFVPEPYRIIRKKTAKLANSLQSIEVKAEKPESVESAKLSTHLLNWLRRKLQWQMVERLAIQESRIIGLAWMKAVWLVDKEEPDKPWKGFDLSFETADAVLISPEATILDIFQGKVKYIIHTYYSDLSTLKANPNYDSKVLQQLELSGGQVKPDRTSLAQARLMYETRNRQADRTRKFRVIEYWGKFSPDEQQPFTGIEQDFLIVTVDDRFILRYGPNPYAQVLDNPIPFIPIVANPIGQELFPVGDIEPAESLFNELNDTRNQRMDTVTLNIDPAKEILRGANIDPKELIARKGWVIHSNIPNGVRFIPPDMQGVKAATEEETIIRGDISQVAGVLDFASGTPVEAGLNIDTARGTLVAKGEADVQTQDEMEILKMSFRMLYRIVLAYAQTFLDRQFTIRVMEQGAEQFYNIDKTSIQGNLDMDIEMKTLQDKTTDQQMKLLLFNQAKEVPGANIGKFFTDVLDAFYENVNIAEYYQKPQPQPPEPPKVSISLKGELNSMEADNIYKTIPGVDPAAADPLLRQDLREMMRGNLPEHKDNAQHKMDMAQGMQELGQGMPNKQNEGI